MPKIAAIGAIGLALVLGATSAHSQTLSAAVCSNLTAQWPSLRSSTNVDKLTDFLHAIPADCPLKSQVQVRINNLRPVPAPPRPIVSQPAGAVGDVGSAQDKQILLNLILASRHENVQFASPALQTRAGDHLSLSDIDKLIHQEDDWRELVLYLVIDKVIFTSLPTGERQIPVSNTEVAVGSVGFEQVIDAAMVEGLTTETVNVSTVVDGQTPKNFSESGSYQPRLCFDSTLTTAMGKSELARLASMNFPVAWCRSPPNGHTAGFAVLVFGAPYSSTIYTRTLRSIFEYVGNSMMVPASKSWPTLKDYGVPGEATVPGRLLTVVTGAPPKAGCFVAVTHESTRYCVPEDVGDNSHLVFEALAALEAIEGP